MLNGLNNQISSQTLGTMQTSTDEDPGNYSLSIDAPERNDYIADSVTTLEGGGEDDLTHNETESSSNGVFEEMLLDSYGHHEDEQDDDDVSVAPTQSAEVEGEPGSAGPEAEPTAVDQPYFDDIIGGRGKQSNDHFGNQNYRQMIRDCCERYHELRNNQQKTAFVEDVVARVKQRGRFLKRKRDGSYVEMSDADAKRKVGQVRC